MISKVEKIITKFEDKAEEIFEQTGKDVPLQKVLDEFIQKDMKNQS